MAKDSVARARSRVASKKSLGKPLSTREVTEIIQRAERYETTFEEIVAVAETFGVPLWVLMVPGIAGPDIEHHMRAVQAIVESYVAGYKGAERRAAS